MTISERIFELIKERGYTQKEFSKRTGIAESTISDWKKKGTNPVSDKILIICKVLEVSPYFLLSGSEDMDAVAKPVAKKPAKPAAASKPAAEKKSDDKKEGKKEDSKKEAKPASGVDKAAVRKEKKVSDILPEIATISKDDDDYHIRPADEADKDKKKDKKDKKKDKDILKDKKKDKKDKKDKKKDKDKKKKKKGYLITY